MPIYEYKCQEKRHCSLCVDGFDRLERITDPALTTCPQCGAKVKRVISAPNLTRASPSLESNNLEKHGFTQYRKASKGVYQKTAGKGPEILSDD
jgi:putative FmdB family regulatory protein